MCDFRLLMYSFATHCKVKGSSIVRVNICLFNCLMSPQPFPQYVTSKVLAKCSLV